MGASELNSDFQVVRRGYDVDDVNRYVDAQEREWSRRLAEATERLGDLEASLAEAQKREEAVNLTLVTATKTKQELMGAAQEELSAAAENAKRQAEKILADAQFEAFRLVTEAKKDAEETIAQARDATEQAADAEARRRQAIADAERMRAEATADAEARVAQAQAEALAMLTEIREESERLVTERDAEFTKMRADVETEYRETLERVTRLRTIAADLEKRLQLAARGALDELGDLTSQLTTELASAPQAVAPPLQEPARPVAPETGADASNPAPAPAPAATTSRPIDPPAPASSPIDETTSRPSKGSFYSRRSAKLPRIGAEAANGALAAVSAMRARTRDAAHTAEQGAREEDLAMQTA
jgi:cell division septum initiation protein DivIVA